MWMMLNPPVPHLGVVEFFGLSHHLVLTHLLQSHKEYKRFYKKMSKKYKHWITLDNSVMELGEPIYDLELIKELNVDEVVAPDYLFNAEKTLDETRNYIDLVRNDYETIGIMGVPQGKNSTEYFRCLISMYENPYITCIGIGKTATSKLHSFEGLPSFFKPLFGRISVLTFICEELAQTKPVHILGNILPEVELPLYAKLPFVRSFDTSYPFRYFSSGKVDSTTNHKDVYDSSILRKCIKWCDEVLSIPGIEV